MITKDQTFVLREKGKIRGAIFHSAFDLTRGKFAPRLVSGHLEDAQTFVTRSFAEVVKSVYDENDLYEIVTYKEAKRQELHHVLGP